MAGTHQIHKLIITRPDVVGDLTNFILNSACKKANRLGKEGVKVKYMSLDQSDRDVWEIKFICENEKWH